MKFFINVHSLTLNTTKFIGKRWESLQQEYGPDVVLLLARMFSDGTQLGGISFLYPLFSTLSLCDDKNADPPSPPTHLPAR